MELTEIVIKKIIEETGVTIDISDDGTVNVASTDPEAANRAIDIIKGLAVEPEIGRIYKGKVTRLMPFGAFVEFMPGKEGLCHVSELSDHFIKDASKEVKVGDEFLVKLVEKDEKGRLNLSRKKALKNEADSDKSKDQTRHER